MAAECPALHLALGGPLTAYSRPEAAGPGRNFQDVPRKNLPVRKKLAMRGKSRQWLMGEI
jgi:hypothetical protein